MLPGRPLTLKAGKGAGSAEGESPCHNRRTSTFFRWLRDCAYGAVGPRSGTGTGTFSTWLSVGNVQHMTHVVRSLRGL